MREYESPKTSYPPIPSALLPHVEADHLAIDVSAGVKAPLSTYLTTEGDVVMGNLTSHTTEWNSKHRFVGVIAAKVRYAWINSGDPVIKGKNLFGMSVYYSESTRTCEKPSDTHAFVGLIHEYD